MAKESQSKSSANSRTPSQHFQAKEIFSTAMCTCDILTVEVNGEIAFMKEKQEDNEKKVDLRLVEFDMIKNKLRGVMRQMKIQNLSIIGVTVAILVGWVVGNSLGH
ncbi:hypothetical protein L1887_14433 [Cichorium endivia]|nr:hypothetical protein L1887_14433 [Cichorium endivia]